MGLQRLFALLKVKRRALLGRCFSEQQRPILKVECRQTDLAGNLRALLPPFQPSCNHQMDHNIQIIFQTQYNPLAHPPQRRHSLPFQFTAARSYGSEQKWACNSDSLQPLTYGSGIQSSQVRDEIRQLRHRMWILTVALGLP